MDANRFRTFVTFFLADQICYTLHGKSSERLLNLDVLNIQEQSFLILMATLPKLSKNTVLLAGKVQSYLPLFCQFLHAKSSQFSEKVIASKSGEKYAHIKYQQKLLKMRKCFYGLLTF